MPNLDIRDITVVTVAWTNDNPNATDFQNMLRLVRQRYGHHSSMGNEILVLVVPQIAIHGRTSCNAIQESWSFCCNR